MILKQKIESELDRLSSLGGGKLDAESSNGRLTSQVTEVDSIACAFNSFELRNDQLQSATIDQLKELCNGLASRVSYLLEPLALVESDADSCTLQMRSNPPCKDEDGTSYYEVVANRQGLSLCRFNKTAGSVREVIPANVTREVFGRLAGDFEAAIG